MKPGSPTMRQLLDAAREGKGGAALSRDAGSGCGSGCGCARSGEEFPEGASQFPGKFSRRRFLELAGASLALAGLNGCFRPRKEEIVPYVRQPENLVPGKPQFYASTFDYLGYGRGIVVEAHEGRPTKIEGNPDHPASGGRSDALMQASVLNLYDPDRLQTPRQGPHLSSWQDFDRVLATERLKLAENGGAGLWVVTEPTTSPTFMVQMAALREVYPQAHWVQHSLLARDYEPLLGHFEEADVVLGIGADFLTEHPESLRYARDFTKRRRNTHPRGVNRFYAAEATPTLTGAMADYRQPLEPEQYEALLMRVAVEMGLGTPPFADETVEELPEAAQRLAHQAAADLKQARGRSIVTAGAHESRRVRGWCHWLNDRLGNLGATLTPVPHTRSDVLEEHEGLDAFATALEAGEVTHLLVIGANPLVARPNLEGAIRDVPFSAAMGLHVNETMAACEWKLPRSHDLEAWGDLVSFTGVPSIVQPLIRPIFDSRSALQVLAGMRGDGSDDYELIRDFWKQRFSGMNFSEAWRQSLHRGTLDSEAFALERPTARSARPPLEQSEPETAAGLTLLVRPDPYLLDGRNANNGWLQELPRPISKLVWDNAFYISPTLAESHQLVNEDVVRIRTGNGTSIEGPVWIVPGQAAEAITVHLGYGGKALGSVAQGQGIDLRPILSEGPWTLSGIGLEKTGEHHSLVTTQHHGSMEGRGLVRVQNAATGEAIALGAGDPEYHEELHESGFYPKDPTGRAEQSPYAWGMAIDLSTCIGCEACVIACQAENNIPVVGKEEVAKGREMHWIRVDRYFAGDQDNPAILHEPLPCMHCENAPCEVVCPVEATLHGPEGLNQMVYNRCIGTRYCSNNCPYKVRRFNFFEYNRNPREPASLQRNPNVTVRERGVMEKCTYCVQRINRARIDAEKEDRQIREVELQTACQQACPTDAIVFGNLKDSQWRVNDLKAEERNYSLLGHLRTVPRTTYLSKFVNLTEATEGES